MFFLLLLTMVGTSRHASPPAVYSPGAGLTFSIEQRHERYWYHFDNDSAFDTTALVPHYFEQHYDSARTWLLVSATYRLGEAAASTEIGFSPEITTFGSDIDTFLQPSGDVVTAGTRGDVFLRSFSISERLGLVTWRGWDTGVALGYRRSRARFAPGDRIITHSQPASETREFTTARETTVSRVIESGFTTSGRFAMPGGWRLTVRADLLPLTRAKLSVSLPDKYPGEDLSAEARALGANARVALERRGRVNVGAAFDAGGAWSYRKTQSYGRRNFAFAVFAGIGG